MEPSPPSGSPVTRSHHVRAPERSLFGAWPGLRLFLGAVWVAIFTLAPAPQARAMQGEAAEATARKEWWQAAPEAWPRLLRGSLGTWGRGKAFAAGPVVHLLLPGADPVWMGAKLSLETAYGGDFRDALTRWVLAAPDAPSTTEGSGLAWVLTGGEDARLAPAPYAGFDAWYVGLLPARCDDPGDVQGLRLRTAPLEPGTPLTLVTLSRSGEQLTTGAEFVADLDGDFGAAGGFAARVPELSARLAPHLVPGAILVDNGGRWCGTLIERLPDGRLEFQGSPLAWPWPAHLEFSTGHERVLDATAHPQLALAGGALTTCLWNPMLGGLRCLGPEGQIWGQRGWRSAAPDATGAFLAAGHADGRLALLDAREGLDMGELAQLNGSIEQLRWIDGARLVAGSLVRGWVVRVDLDSAEPKWRRAMTPTALAVGPRVLVGQPDGSVAFLKISDGSGKPLKEAHTAPVSAAGWSGNGQYAATGDAAGTVHLWSAAGELLRSWSTGRAPIGGLAFAPGPKNRPCLWVGCGDLEEEDGDLYCFGANVRALDLQDGREWARSPELDFPVTDLAYAPPRGLVAPASLLCISGRGLLSVRLRP